MSDELTLTIFDIFNDSFFDGIRGGLGEVADCSAEETLASKFARATETAGKAFAVTFSSSLILIAAKLLLSQLIERQPNPVILRKLLLAKNILKRWGQSEDSATRTYVVANAICALLDAEVEAEVAHDHRKDLLIKFLIGLCGRVLGERVAESYLVPFIERAVQEREKLRREKDEDAGIISELETKLRDDEKALVKRIPKEWPRVNGLFASNLGTKFCYYREGRVWRAQGKKDPLDKIVTIKAPHAELVKQLLFFRMYEKSRDRRLDSLAIFLNLCALKQVSDVAFETAGYQQ